MFYDVTVVNPFITARLCASRRAGNPPYAAESGYDGKVAKHFAALLAAEPTARFVPHSVTALRDWDSRSMRAPNYLARSIAAATGYENG